MVFSLFFPPEAGFSIPPDSLPLTRALLASPGPLPGATGAAATRWRKPSDSLMFPLLNAP